jgi:hypothetical protein
MFVGLRTPVAGAAYSLVMVRAPVVLAENFRLCPFRSTCGVVLRLACTG